MQPAPIKPTIEDDRTFRRAVEMLSEKASSSEKVRGFFLTAFVVDAESGAIELHTHQEASEQMLECMLREFGALVGACMGISPKGAVPS